MKLILSQLYWELSVVWDIFNICDVSEVNTAPVFLWLVVTRLTDILCLITNIITQHPKGSLFCLWCIECPSSYNLLQNVGQPARERKEYTIHDTISLNYVDRMECRPQWQLRPWAALTWFWGFQYRSGHNVMFTCSHVLFSCTAEGFAVVRCYQISKDFEF